MNALSADWKPFTRSLAATLRQLREDQFLVLSVKHSSRYVQFAAQGAFGMRAETVSNHFLPEKELLSEEQVANLVEAGWHLPTKAPDQSTPEQDPDGSPNFFADFRKPGTFTGIARKAVATLVGVLAVPHPGFLEYYAFDGDGAAIMLPELGLKRSEPSPLAGQTLAERVQATVCELTRIRDLKFDADGDIGVTYGEAQVFIRPSSGPAIARVSFFSTILTEAEKTPLLLSQINDFNTEHTRLHFFLSEGNVYVVAELLAEPYDAKNVSIVLHHFSVAADKAAQLLAARFGSDAPRSESNRPLVLH